MVELILHGQLMGKLHGEIYDGRGTCLTATEFDGLVDGEVRVAEIHVCQLLQGVEAGPAEGLPDDSEWHTLSLRLLGGQGVVNLVLCTRELVALDAAIELRLRGEAGLVAVGGEADSERRI